MLLRRALGTPPPPPPANPPSAPPRPSRLGRPSPPPPRILVFDAVRRTVVCPHCKVRNEDVDVAEYAYTGAACSICMHEGRMVVYPTCRHAMVCATCTLRMA